MEKIIFFRYNNEIGYKNVEKKSLFQTIGSFVAVIQPQTGTMGVKIIFYTLLLKRFALRPCT